MRWDDEALGARSPAETEHHPTEQVKRHRLQRGLLLSLAALVVVIVGVAALLLAVQFPTRFSWAASHTSPPSAPVSSRDAAWHDVGLSASEQIVFARGTPQTGYSCGIANKTVIMHVTHNGGMSWRPLLIATPIASESCVLAVDETNPQQLALMTLVTTPDPYLTSKCTPTPCASACQSCIDYCPPPPQQTLTLYRSVDGGITWKSSAPLPHEVHFTLDIAFAGATLYAWTDTWPTLLASSVAGEPFHLINLSAYFPRPRSDGSSQSYQAPTHLWPLLGQLYVPIPSDDANRYILTDDGGLSWTRRTFTMEGDPVVLRTASGLDGRTLMGERIHTIGRLVLSVDGGNTWQPAPAPYPDFSHFGQTQCYASADGSFIWFNGFDATFGFGVYVARPGATTWTKLLDVAQIQDISVDLVSYDANGHVVALWARESRTKWVVHRLP